MSTSWFRAANASGVFVDGDDAKIAGFLKDNTGLSREKFEIDQTLAAKTHLGAQVGLVKAALDEMMLFVAKETKVRRTKLAEAQVAPVDADKEIAMYANSLVALEKGIIALRFPAVYKNGNFKDSVLGIADSAHTVV